MSKICLVHVQINAAIFVIFLRYFRQNLPDLSNLIPGVDVWTRDLHRERMDHSVGERELTSSSALHSGLASYGIPHAHLHTGLHPCHGVILWDALGLHQIPRGWTLLQPLLLHQLFLSQFCAPFNSWYAGPGILSAAQVCSTSSVGRGTSLAFSLLDTFTSHFCSLAAAPRWLRGHLADAPEKGGKQVL